MLKVTERLTKGDVHGIHYAVSIFFATIVLWVILHEVAKDNPIWAISSMVATSDPSMKQSLPLFRSRLINTLVGCAVGLLFIALGVKRVITLPLAMAATVLLSAYVVRIPSMWRQGPITAAFVIAAGLEHHLRIEGLRAGMNRVFEVLFGCIVGLAVGWLVSVLWPEPAAAAPAAGK
jgi:uncharacterized membrane protein YccC